MLFFSVLSALLNPIRTLLRVKPSGFDDFKNIFPSVNGTLKRTFFEPFRLVYQSLTLSLMFEVSANFSIKSIYLGFFH